MRKIVSSLAVELTGKEQEELSTADDVDPEAYDLLLRGLERFRRFTRETNAEAREFFARAAGIDPTYAARPCRRRAKLRHGPCLRLERGP